MGVGTSLFLIAVGAVLKYAVHVTAHGFNIQTVGVILIIVGAGGLLISLLWMAAWSRGNADVLGRDGRVPPRLR